MRRGLDFLAIAAMGVIALALAAGSAQAAYSRNLLQLDPEDLEFPPLCNCIRNSTESPYSLELVSAGTVTGFFQYCFEVKKSTTCDLTSKCCNDNQGVHKVEFEANFDCKPVLRRVTFNGRNHSAWEFNKLGVVRVTSLNLTSASAAGAQVCLFLRISNDSSSCSFLNTFCTLSAQACKYAIFQTDRGCCPVGVTGFLPPPPIAPGGRVPPAPAPPSPGPSVVPISAPPPAPPPRTNFPNCSCLKDAAGSQLYVKPTASVSDPDPANRNLTKICFEIGASASASCAASGSPCCQFNVHKVELEADPNCAPALSHQTIDGVWRPRSFQYNPYPTIKFTGISKAFDQAAGTELCLFMRSECASLTELSVLKDGVIAASVFNAPAELENCCPTTDVVAAP